MSAVDITRLTEKDLAWAKSMRWSAICRVFRVDLFPFHSRLSQYKAKNRLFIENFQLVAFDILSSTLHHFWLTYTE